MKKSALIVIFISFMAMGMAMPVDRDTSFPQNTYGFRDLAMDSISNDTIRQKYFQIANEIDYCGQQECAWYKSKEFKIGDESYIVLYQDYYHARNYYLSRLPIDNAYPEILKICEESLAGETFQWFEIDPLSDTITLIYNIKCDNCNDGTFTINSQYEQLYRIHKDIYRLSDEFKLIESTDTLQVLPDSEAIIDIYGLK